MKRTTLLAAALAVIACNNSATKPLLTQFTDVTADTKCPTGGVKISAGTDTDGSGTLDASEVTQSSELCNGATGSAGAAGAAGANGTNGATGANGTNGTNGTNGANGDAGANGAASLIKTTLLASGNADCPNGGVKIDFGLDNGDGGGVAANGTLEVGEVDGSKNVCNGTQPYYPQSVAPPAGPVGTSHIFTRGGFGSSSNGGPGASIDIYFDQGTLGGNTMVFNTGSLDAGFVAPSVAFTAGTNPMTVAQDFTLNIFDAVDDGVASGQPYFLVNNDNRIYSADAGVVTSVSVAANAVLTLDSATNSYVSLNVRNGFKNDGTIVTKSFDALNGTSLEISAKTFSSAETSVLSTVGLDGGYAGNLSVEAAAGVVLAGRVDAYGRGNAQGANFSIDSNSACASSATIRTNGGSSQVGDGASGGQVSINCRSLALAGLIDASGGSGDRAGNGNNVYLNANVGGLTSSAQVITNGGSCSAAGCNGGSGNSVYVYVSGGDLVWNGSVSTTGGAAGSAGNRGGSGGYVSMYADNQDGRPTGTMHIAGNIDTSGGSGPSGGDANSVNIELSPGYTQNGQQIILYGYAEFDSSGGSSTTSSGGDSGSINISNNYSRIFNSRVYGPGGSVVNYAKLTSRGGDGVNAGRSNGVSLQTQTSYPFRFATEKVINFGDITLGSGDSSSQPVYAYAGQLSIEGESGVENHGALSANGGTQSGGPNSSGNGGYISLYSAEGPITNTGAIRVNAGSATGQGGNGGTVNIYGTVVTNSGSLAARGGNSAAAGGGGGSIDLYSSVGPSVNTGTLSAAGGNGTPPGYSGGVYVDGVEQP